MIATVGLAPNNSHTVVSSQACWSSNEQVAFDGSLSELESSVHRPTSLQSTLTIDEGATAELQFWKSSLQIYNSQPIWHHPGAVCWYIQILVILVFGGYAGEVSHGHWNPQEAQQSYVNMA